MNKNERHATPADFSAYLDGRLAGAGREGFESHLAGCGECGRRLRELELLRDLMRELPAADPGPGFERAVLERARDRGRRYAFAAWYRRTAYGLAGLGLILIVAIYLQRPAPLMETGPDRLLEVQPAEAPAKLPEAGPPVPAAKPAGEENKLAGRFRKESGEESLRAQGGGSAVKLDDQARPYEAAPESADRKAPAVGSASTLSKAELAARPPAPMMSAPVPAAAMNEESGRGAVNRPDFGLEAPAPAVPVARESAGPVAGSALDAAGRRSSISTAGALEKEAEVRGLEGASRSDTLTAATGSDSGPRLARLPAVPANLLIRNRRDWSRLWQTQNTVQNLSLPLPPVDFRKQMVVAVPTRQENRVYQVMSSEEKEDRVIIYYRDVTTEKCDKDEAPPEPPYQVQVVNVRPRIEFQKAP